MSDCNRVDFRARILDTYNFVHMLHNLTTRHLGVAFKKLAKRFIDLGQVVLTPFSVSLR